jgi:hypothetical protein
MAQWFIRRGIGDQVPVTIFVVCPVCGGPWAGWEATTVDMNLWRLEWEREPGTRNYIALWTFTERRVVAHPWCTRVQRMLANLGG